MSVHHSILSQTYYPLKLAKVIGKSLNLSSKNRLRVLLYHDIPPQEQDRFAEQLRWLAHRWTFISPNKFEKMIYGEEPIHGFNLLLTFDDGFSSNRIVAEQILNPMGIQALFFVVSDLVAIEDPLQARDFISKNLYPDSTLEKAPKNWNNMSWNDLSALLEQGHTIGCHTRTHKRLSQIISNHELEQEIITSADIIEKKLGMTIKHFSYPFGDLTSFSEPALAIARKYFRFVHSGLRGDNAKARSPFAIRRDSAATQDNYFNYKIFSKNLMGAFLEGAADFKYKKDISLLDQWSHLNQHQNQQC